jgi:AcrR family transcriptional regulator
MSRSAVTAKKTPINIRTFRGVSTEQRREARRARLLAAAIRTFGTRGFHRTTVRDVCSEAQLTERYFYESFVNLASLYSAAHQQVTDQLREAIVLVVTSGPREPLAMAEGALRVYLGFLSEDRPRARLLLIESLAVGDELSEQASASAREFVTLLRGLAELLYPSAASQGLDLAMVASGLVGATNAIAYDWTQRDFETPLEDVLRNVLALYQGMILQLRAHAPERASTSAVPARGAKKRVGKPRSI